MDIKIKNKKEVILKYVVIVVICISVFCLSYNFFNSNHTANNAHLVLKDSNLENLANINEKSNGFINSNTLNVDETHETIPKIIDELSQAKDNIDFSKYSNEKSSALQNAIDNNILVYLQIEAMLKNPEGKDLETSASNLNSYYDSSCK